MNKNVYYEAHDFSKKEISNFKRILIEAGEVSEIAFDGLVAQNPKILFINNTENPKGIGALKIPNKSYKESKFKSSKSNKNPDSFPYELGWVVSREKGSGNKIVKILSESDQNIYATVREENEVMIYLLKKYGFKQEGFSFNSERGNYKILLFIKQQNGL